MAFQKNVIFISIVISFLGTGLTIIFPILPQYLEQFGGGTWEFGIAASIYALSGLIFSPIVGKIADRVGKKEVIVFNLSAYGIINLLLIWAPNFEIFLLLRFLQGIFGSSTFPPAISLVSDITVESERGRNIAFVTAGISFGTIVGPTLGGILFDLFGLVAPYVLSGLLGIIGGVLSVFILPEGRKSTSAGKSAVPLLSQIPRPIWAFGILLLLSFINTVTWMIIEPGFIYHFYNTLGYSASQFGIFVSIYGVFVFVGEIFFGGISDKIGRRPVMMFAAAINTLFYYYLGVAEDLMSLNIAAAIAGIAGGLYGPALNALLSDVSEPDTRTFNYGLMTSASNIAMIVGPFFGGWFLTQPGNDLLGLTSLSAGIVATTIFLTILLKFTITRNQDTWEESESKETLLYPKPIGERE